MRFQSRARGTGYACFPNNISDEARHGLCLTSLSAPVRFSYIGLVFQLLEYYHGVVLRVSDSKKIDPITIEIIRERLITIVREMRGNMLRAAFSSAVCELHDMSCAVLDDEGQLLALSDGDNPQHVFPILWSASQMRQ